VAKIANDEEHEASPKSANMNTNHPHQHQRC